MKYHIKQRLSIKRNYKMNKMQILNLKRVITKMTVLLEEFISRFKCTEEKMYAFEDTLKGFCNPRMEEEKE